MNRTAVSQTEQEFRCLPEAAWGLLVVSFVPHLLALTGAEFVSLIAAYILFPISMGPFALVHAYLVVNQLGFTSHMVWISALIFSQVWFTVLCCAWKRDKRLTLVISSLVFLAASGWIWLRLMPMT